MKKLLAIVWGITWRTTLFLAVIGAGLWWMNRPQGWDARTAFEKQDTRLEGRIGVVVVGLAMPERYNPVFFENFLGKLFTSVIPWPINVFAGADAGVALLDPTNPMAAERFQPKELADIWGRTRDIDGIPWVEKYRRGEVRFVKPTGSVAHDHGFFLYPARKGGVRTATAKTMLKARYTMYAALPDGYLPHESQTRALGEAAITDIKARHPVVAAAFADAFDPWQKEQAVRAVLDAGADTLVLSSLQPIYSDFEELRGSFPQVYKSVQAWRKENANKPIKIVIAPAMSTQDSFDAIWVKHLNDLAPPATAPTQTARVVISLHGLPPSLVNSDSWSGRYPAMVKRLSPKLEQAMRAKGYGKVVVETGFEGFADPPEDPNNVSVSVAELITKGRQQKDDLVFVVPVEFMAENTDTLFSHAAIMFEGLPGYTNYMGPPVGTDWTKPYVRSFQAGTTRVIYSGSPGTDAAVPGGKSLADAMATLWK
jgi:protoheme ferro-lyase